MGHHSAGSQKTEVRGQRSEVRRQRTKDRGQQGDAASLRCQVSGDSPSTGSEQESEFRREQSNGFKNLSGLYDFNDLSDATRYLSCLSRACLGELVEGCASRYACFINCQKVPENFQNLVQRSSSTFPATLPF
jgi:hypothetical protein